VLVERQAPKPFFVFIERSLNAELHAVELAMVGGKTLVEAAGWASVGAPDAQFQHWDDPF
jgi:hypothetical protein